MRLHIIYTLEIEADTLHVLINYANTLGFGFDNPPTEKLLKRLFQAKGTEVVRLAKEEMKDETINTN